MKPKEHLTFNPKNADPKVVLAHLKAANLSALGGAAFLGLGYLHQRAGDPVPELEMGVGAAFVAYSAYLAAKAILPFFKKEKTN